MVGEVIDEAYVEIKAKIDPKFDRDIKREVDKAVKPIAADVEKSLAPVRKTVKDSIQEPFEDAADSVRDSMRGVGEDVKTSVRSATRDFDRFSRKIDEVEKELRRLRREAADRIEVDLDADTSDVETKIKALEGSLRRLRTARNDIEINVDVDNNGIRRTGTLLSGFLSSLPIFGKRFFKAFAEVGEAATRTGSQVAQAGAEAAGGAGQIGAALAKMAASSGPAAVAVVAAISAIAVAIGALMAALTALLSVVTHAIGGLIPLGVAVSSLGVAFATVKVGSNGVTDAIKAQAKAQQELAETGQVSEATQKALASAMGDLSPAARNVVKAIGDLTPAWEKVQRSVQQKLFQGFGRELRDLGKTYLPVLKEGLGGFARDLNGLGKSLSDFLTRTSVVEKFRDVFASLRMTFAELAPAIGNVFAGFGNLFVGSLPAAQTMAESIRNISESFRAWTAQIVNDGSFEGFLSRAKASLSAIGRLFGEIGGLIKRVFSTGFEAGIQIVQDLTAAFMTFNDFLDSGVGQASLRGWFDLGEMLVKSFIISITAIGVALTPIGVLVDGIGSAFMSMVKVADDAIHLLLEGLASVVEKIASAADKFGPIGDGLAKAFGTSTEEMKDFARGLGDSADKFGHFGERTAEADSRTSTFQQTLEQLKGSLPTLGDAFSKTASQIEVNVKSVEEAMNFGLGDDSRFSQAVKRIPALVDANLVAPWEVARGKVKEGTSLTLAEFKKLPSSVQETFKNLGGSVVAPMDQMARNMRNKALNAVTLTSAEFSQLPERVREVLKNLGVRIAEPLKEGTAEIRKQGNLAKQEAVRVGKEISDALRSPFEKGLIDAGKFQGPVKPGAKGKPAQASSPAAAPKVEIPKIDISPITAAQTAITSATGKITAAVNALRSIVVVGVNQIKVAFISLPPVVTSSVTSIGTALIALVRVSDGAKTALVGNVAVIRNTLNSLRGAATAGVAGVIARLNALSNSITSTRIRVVSEVNRINAALAKLKTPGGAGGGGGVDGNPLTAYARGGIVDKATLALIGEAGKEVVVPVTRATRAASLVAKSGLADLPEVQKVILDRLRLSVSDTTARSLADARGPIARMGGPALPPSTREALSRPARSVTPLPSPVSSTVGSSKTYEDNRVQNFHLPPVDPETLATIINNRNDPSWSER